MCLFFTKSRKPNHNNHSLFIIMQIAYHQLHHNSFTMIKLNAECSINMIKYLPNLHQINSKRKE